MSLVCWALLAAFLVVFFLPLVPNKRLRYYACYVYYVVVVSTIGSCFIPIFMLRPLNPVNLIFASNRLKWLTKIMGIEWEIRNAEILDRRDHGGSIIAMNHQTILDIMGLFNIWNQLGMATVVAKKELLFVPPFGPVAWLCGLVYIDRSNPALANEQIKKASDHLKSKTHLCLFPEGTRNFSKTSLLPFKKGTFRVAIDCQAPIIPVVFSPYYFVDSDKKEFSWGRIVISVLEPIETKGMTHDDLPTLLDNTYKIMSDEYKKLGEEVNTFKKYD